MPIASRDRPDRARGGDVVKYCVIPGIDGKPDSEYIMGTYPNADAECRSSGGRVVDRSEGVAARPPRRALRAPTPERRRPRP
ncbi:hypothetical protein GCM10027187_03320 [Streptosporangium sandarakinum]